MVRMLLERGANANKPDLRGWTPKALAKANVNSDIYDLILNYENKKKADAVTSYSSKHQCANSSIYAKSSSSQDAIKSEKKRITIHMKSEKENKLPKLLILPDSLQELLEIAGQKFGDCNLTTVVNAEDTEIDDVNVIRDGDHLFFLSSQCRKTDHQ